MSATLPARAQSAPAAPIRYQVSPAQPDAHCFELELAIPASAGVEGRLQLALPAWLPGSYMIRDFARNLLELTAEQASGHRLDISKLDKQTWQITGIDSAVTVRYQVYAWELSVRSAHLDRTHGYFNGACLFLRVQGQEHQPCLVELLPPPAPQEALDQHGDDGAENPDHRVQEWRVATSLARAGAPPWGFGTYRADHYADLIDHPVEMGRFDLLEFNVQGVPHALAVSGRHHADLARLLADLPRVCAEHAALFGALPIDRYLFLLQVVGNGYGGLEHAYSSSLLANRNDLPPAPGCEAAASSQPTWCQRDPAPSERQVVGEGYRRLLGLCSHEYFHLWHVKRIQPLAFAEQRLDREVHTRLLWAFEGITSYYDDLALVRCGLIDTKAYLTVLAETITRVLRNPGRRRQTVAESSFDAWTRFYKQDENAPNAIVSYYSKGALVALALDLTLRRDSGGRTCLDDLMRALWEQHGRSGVGVGEHAIEALASRLSGLDLSGFFAQALDSTADLPLADLLATVGIGWRLRPARGANDWGGVFASGAAALSPRADLGIRLQPEAREATLAVVLTDRPAQRAGLAAGDVLIAVDGLRVDAANLEATLARLPLDRSVPVHAFRRDELMRFQVSLAAAPADTCELALLEDAPAAARAARADWLRSRQT